MSRNIKSLKTLAKHIGRTMSIVNSDGIKFLAVLDRMKDGNMCLHTSDSKAEDAEGWWNSENDSRTEDWKDQWCHIVRYGIQLTEELKSCSLISGNAKTEKVVHYATDEEVKEHVGDMCKLEDGTIGKLVKRGKNVEPLLLLKEEAFNGSVGWSLKCNKDTVKYLKDGWNYGWNMHDQGCETAKIVEFFDEDPTVKKKRVKKAKKIEVETKKIILADKLKKCVGHYCEMYDGSMGFIARSCYEDNVCVIHNSKKSSGWPIAGRYDEIKGVNKTFIKRYKFGWHVDGDDQAAQIKVTKILGSSEAYEPEESTTKKTLLDMTVRELLEKLNEIVER